jgi:hypothetical protein
VNEAKGGAEMNTAVKILKSQGIPDIHYLPTTSAVAGYIKPFDKSFVANQFLQLFVFRLKANSKSTLEKIKQILLILRLQLHPLYLISINSKDQFDVLLYLNNFLTTVQQFGKLTH